MSHSDETPYDDQPQLPSRPMADPAEPRGPSFETMPPWEQIPETTHFDQLTAVGIEIPPAEELDDASLPTKLWEIIGALAALRVYLHDTDHLSDRELYVRLQEILLEPTKDLAAVLSREERETWSANIDLIGSGSDEDHQVNLRYYCSESERRLWAEPDLAMPPREKPPFDRDRRLPDSPWHGSRRPYRDDD